VKTTWKIFRGILAAAGLCAASMLAQAQFVGELVLEPAGCTQTGK